MSAVMTLVRGGCRPRDTRAAYVRIGFLKEPATLHTLYLMLTP